MITMQKIPRCRDLSGARNLSDFRDLSGCRNLSESRDLSGCRSSQNPSSSLAISCRLLPNLRRTRVAAGANHPHLSFLSCGARKIHRGEPHATGVGLLCLYFDMGFCEPSREYRYNAHAFLCGLHNRSCRPLPDSRRTRVAAGTIHPRISFRLSGACRQRLLSWPALQNSYSTPLKQWIHSPSIVIIG